MYRLHISVNMLKRNIWKSISSLLGIIIGVATIVVILSISQGGKAVIEKDLNYIGESATVISSTNSTFEDIALIESLPFVEYLRIKDSTFNIVEKNLSVKAISEKEAKLMNINLLQNQGILESDKSNIVEGDYLDIKVANTPLFLEIKKVTKKDDKGKERMNKEKNSLNWDTLYILNSNLKNYYTKERLSSGIVVYFTEDENVEESTEILLNLINRDRVFDKYVAEASNSKYKVIENIKRTLTLFLGSIGAVSLLLGSLGIANQMNLKIRERKNSIGMLLAVGSKKSDILKIFIYELLILLILGNILGIGIGVLASIIIGKMIEISPIFNIFDTIIYLIISISTSILLCSIGIVKLSKLSIVESLKGR